MATLDSPSGPTVVHVRRSPRRVAWGSVLAVVLSVVVWVSGTWLLDASSLGSGDGLFGYNFAAAIYSAFVGVPLHGLVALFSGGSGGDAVFALVTIASAGVLLAPGWFAWDVLAGR
ncbi:hypothetical protein IEQ44_09720 [Nocardioides sp. Y6]|uniref:Cell division protein FtsK n=1 Tax=Nocardioides malaquae TaxID=2773426 RepID=A0ABR9RTL7_9ACTN|nr:hypothetical protein [Nocardioides malaquae]MBE7324934.1 hypothetical protein [Nocardioides malaquae]